MIGKLFTLRECAAWCQVRDDTIKKWIQRGEAMHQQFGNRYYLNTNELSLLLWAKNPLRAPEFDKQNGVYYEDR